MKLVRKVVPLAVAAVCAFVVSPARAKAGPSRTLHVACGASPGGDGSAHAPFDSITAAVEAGRTLSATHRLTIAVAEGVCDRETLPIRLDYSVVLRGSREPRYDGRGFPLDGQTRDTLVTWPSDPIPEDLLFFEITGDRVHLSRLSLDGNVEPPPIGVAAFADEFVIEQMRIIGADIGVWVANAGGWIAGNYVGQAITAGIFLEGGDKRPHVVCLNNRIEDYRFNGIDLAGVTEGGEAVYVALDALVMRNDVATSYTNTGPSNPAALRLAPAVLDSFGGHVTAAFLHNEVRGTPRYTMLVQGGTPRRRPDLQHYTGTVKVTFFGTKLDEAARNGASLITFTHVRASVFPCELDPRNDRSVCPSLSGNPPRYWEYLQGAVFEVWHGGELNSVKVDHPAIDPVDGRDLGNRLIINGRVVAER